MIILGIDPGYAIVGFGVIEKLGHNIRVLDYGVITTPKEHTMPVRLKTIYDSLCVLIDKYKIGICYEETGGTASEAALGAFLRAQYERKQKGEPIEYEPDETVFSRFEYGAIVRELEQKMMEIRK